jgi:hypothetical protein
VNYIEGNQHGQKKNARNKRRFSKATKNFKTHATQTIQKKRKTKILAMSRISIMQIWLNMKPGWFNDFKVAY